MIIHKRYGIVFWITGISGSGKTTLSRKIYPFVKKKFETIIQNPIIPIDQNCYKVSFKKIKLAISRYFASNGLSLPVGSHLSNAQQKRIILEINRFYEK